MLLVQSSTKKDEKQRIHLVEKFSLVQIKYLLFYSALFVLLISSPKMSRKLFHVVSKSSGHRSVNYVDTGSDWGYVFSASFRKVGLWVVCRMFLWLYA